MCKKHKSRLAGRELKKATDAIERAERDERRIENAKKRFQTIPEKPVQPEKLKRFVYSGVGYDFRSIEELMAVLGTSDQNLIGCTESRGQIHLWLKTKEGIEKLFNVRLEDDPVAMQYFKDITTNKNLEEQEAVDLEIRAGLLCTSSSM